MKAAERLAALAGNIAQSIETNRQTGVITPQSASGTPNRYAGLERVKGAVLIPVAKIEPDPDQPRKEFEPDALQRLADSLKDRGQLVPIQVRWAADRWVIVAGERRWRAAGLAGMDRLACIEIQGELSPQDRVRTQLMENCVREDLKPVEQARAFEALMAFDGLTQRDLAEQLHIAQGTVSKALALLRLPEPIQDQVDAGEIPARVGIQIARADPTERPALIAEATGKTARREPSKPRLKPVRLEVPGGRVTVVLEEQGGPDEWEAALTAALRKVRGMKRGAA